MFVERPWQLWILFIPSSAKEELSMDWALKNRVWMEKMKNVMNWKEFFLLCFLHTI
jgi:hypothetical protein